MSILNVKNKGTSIEVDGFEIDKDSVNVGIKKFHEKLFDIIYLNKINGSMIGFTTGFFKIKEVTKANTFAKQLAEIAGLSEDKIKCI